MSPNLTPPTSKTKPCTFYHPLYNGGVQQNSNKPPINLVIVKLSPPFLMDASTFRIPHTFSIFNNLRSPSLLNTHIPISSPFSLSRNLCANSKNPSSFKVEDEKAKGTNDGVVFDEAAYEAQRLSLDAKARESMAEASEREIGDGDDPKAWKWVIRKRVWDLMEAQNIAQFPRPVHHRIPNFVGASEAALKLSGLEVFLEAKCVKVNPDTPQKQVRFQTLTGGKKLLTPQPRLRTGFFSILESSMLTPSTVNEACTSVGVAKYGRPIGLDEKIKVDLIVIGSVAVDPRTGARLGKGEVKKS